MTAKMTDEANEAGRAALDGLVRLMVDATNTLSAYIPLDVIANTLFSGAATLLLNQYGREVAAERLHDAVEVFAQEQETSH